MTTIRAVILLTAAFLLGTSALGQDPAAPGTATNPPADSPHEHDHDHEPPAYRNYAWPEAVLDLAARLPVQEEGRLKPMATQAAFHLLRLNGKRSATVKRGTGPDAVEERLTPTAFYLDAMFFPEQALTYRILLVEDDDVLDAIGLAHEGHKKRDRYSYRDLQPALESLFAEARRVAALAEDDRTIVERKLHDLASNLLSFQDLLQFASVALVPPPRGEVQWLVPQALRTRVDDPRFADQTRVLLRLRELAAHRGDPVAFERELRALSEQLRGMASEHEEHESAAREMLQNLDREVTFYRADWFGKAQALFVLAFLLTSLVFLAPRARMFGAIAYWSLAPPLVLLSIGIVIRGIIRGRPPVTTLYESILFITAVAVLLAMIAESLTRLRIAQFLGALLGAAGVYFAAWFEEVSKVDTMPQLQAVLDTNFWLATHVTTVTIGYAAGFLAAALGNVWVFSKLFGKRSHDRSWSTVLTRMVYGVVCFGLLFSTVGTILGGIWANDSWGRFWGWDPKENGALMIVLGNLILLHGRVGGFLREAGLNIGAVLLGTVVTFSWFHTNNLGVGLHAYGFTKELHTLVWTIYGFQWSVAGLGLLAHLRERWEKAAVARAGADEPLQGAAGSRG